MLRRVWSANMVHLCSNLRVKIPQINRVNKKPPGGNGNSPRGGFLSEIFETPSQGSLQEISGLLIAE